MDANNPEGRLSLKLAGTYVGHIHTVTCVVEKDRDAIVTGSWDGTLREWNTTTCDCLNVVDTGDHCVDAMIKTRNGKHVVYGLLKGRIEMRTLRDLRLVSTFNLPSSIMTLCELRDGSFVSAAFNSYIWRWNERGTILQSFYGQEFFLQVIELNENVIVSAARDLTLKMWQVSNETTTGLCLHTMSSASDSDPFSGHVHMAKLSDHKFASVSSDRRLRVWNHKGECMQTIQTDEKMEAVTRVGNYLVAFSQSLIEVRRLLRSV